MRILAGVVGLGIVLSLGAQVPVAPNRMNIKTDAELDAEAKQADALYQQQRSLEALPLYEELHAQRPSKTYYTVHLAISYIAKGGAATSPEAKKAAQDRARQLLEEAKAAGDNSDLTQVLISQLDEASARPKAQGPPIAGKETLDQAEILFNKGDLKGAMAMYEKAYQENSQYYSIPLFAGDAEYKMDHYEEAGVWFQRAIAIAPDRETAHRYWADCLSKAGKTAEAHKQFVEAFVAEPYAKAPRLVLKTWAKSHALQYVAPPIVIPIQAVTNKDGGTNINMDPARMADQNYMAWIGYPMQTVAWRKDKFAAAYPAEKTYRHSLAEEAEGLRTFLTIVRANKKLPPEQYDATTRSLMALEKDGMLECWILVDNPDQGIAQDYAGYRATHRELLKAYVEKYDLHPA